MAYDYYFNIAILSNTVILFTEDIPFTVFQYQVVNLGFLKGHFSSRR